MTSERNTEGRAQESTKCQGSVSLSCGVGTRPFPGISVQPSPCGIAHQGSSPAPWHWVCTEPRWPWQGWWIDWLVDWLPMCWSQSRSTETLWPKVPTVSLMIGFSGRASPCPKSCSLTMHHNPRLPGRQRHTDQEHRDYFPEAEGKGQTSFWARLGSLLHSGKEWRGIWLGKS